jgi:hypothetical protein
VRKKVLEKQFLKDRDMKKIFGKISDQRNPEKHPHHRVLHNLPFYMIESRNVLDSSIGQVIGILAFIIFETLGRKAPLKSKRVL